MGPLILLLFDGVAILRVDVAVTLGVGFTVSPGVRVGGEVTILGVQVAARYVLVAGPLSAGVAGLVSAAAEVTGHLICFLCFGQGFLIAILGVSWAVLNLLATGAAAIEV